MTIVKKFETQEIKKNSPKKYLIVIVICFFVLILFEIWVNNSSVTYGDKFQKLFTLTKTITLENEILENQIAQQLALNNIASKSAELGFSQPDSIEYIR